VTNGRLTSIILAITVFFLFDVLTVESHARDGTSLASQIPTIVEAGAELAVDTSMGATLPPVELAHNPLCLVSSPFPDSLLAPPGISRSPPRLS
jgi:hypothetical protein